MTDSPRAQMPIDPDERPIEGQLLQIRNALEMLKQDKSCYVKSADVIRLYKATIEQVRALNELRARKDKRNEQNRGELPFHYSFALHLVALSNRRRVTSRDITLTL
jgi:ABC-type uncharacterized transport system fused permease/ATPase subunit